MRWVVVAKGERASVELSTNSRQGHLGSRTYRLGRNHKYRHITNKKIIMVIFKTSMSRVLPEVSFSHFNSRILRCISSVQILAL